MNADEIVRTLRWLSIVRTYCDEHIVNCHDCEFSGFCTDPDCDESVGKQAEWMKQAADLIESLQAQLEQKTNEAEGMRSNWYKCIENLKESQRREQAAVEDINSVRMCHTCKHFLREFGMGGIECKTPCATIRHENFEWRGIRGTEE